MAVAHTPCRLCTAYIADTLESAPSPFSARARRRFSQSILELAVDTTKAIHSYQSHYKADYLGFLGQCQTMETFTGRDQMLGAFFQGQPQCASWLSHWLILLQEKGVAKEDLLRPWLQDQFFRLFSQLLELHAHHTQAEPVLHLESPAAALFQEKKPALQVVVAAVQTRDDFDDVDLLYC
jgi:hypothetical protein